MRDIAEQPREGVQFSIDNLCAKFTTDSLCRLVELQLQKGPATVQNIAREITGSDPSLDLKSGEQLAEAAVRALVKRGQATVQGALVYQVASAGDRT